MPKILISSDHHHDNYKSFSKITENGITARLKESLAAEWFLSMLMLKHGIKHHIRCGDLFDKKDVVESVAYSEVFRRIQANAENGIEEIALVGNHDTAAGFVRHTLELFEMTDIMTVIDEPSCAIVAGIECRFIPHMENIEEYLLAARDRNHDCQLLFTHVGVNGAKTGSEFLLPHYIDPEDLQPDLYDYIFMGHVHEPQQIRNNMAYIGNLVQRNFSDEGAARRCIILDVESGTMESVPIPGPQFHTVEINNEDELKSFTVNDGDYYRVTMPTSLDFRLARDIFSQAAGASINPTKYDSETHIVVPRISEQISWEEACKEYVEQTRPELEREELLAVAREILTHNG